MLIFSNKGGRNHYQVCSNAIFLDFPIFSSARNNLGTIEFPLRNNNEITIFLCPIANLISFETRLLKLLTNECT